MSDPLNDTLDARAFALQQRLSAEIDPPGDRRILSASLGRYLALTEAEGREPFAAALAPQRAQAARVRGLFASPDVPGLATDYTGADAQEFRQRSAVIAHFAHSSGKDPESLALRWPTVRAAYARENLGKDDAGDGEIFAHVAAGYSLDEQIAATAAKAGVSGASSVVAWADSAETFKASPAWSEAKRDAYRERFTAAADRVSSRLAPYRTTITATVSDLKRIMGTADGEASADFEGLADRMLAIPKKDRAYVLKAIADLGGSTGEDKGIGQKLAESVWRGVVPLATGLPDAMQRSALLSMRQNLDHVQIPAGFAGDVTRYALAESMRPMVQAFTGGNVQGGAAGQAIGALMEDRRGLTDEEKAQARAGMDRALDAADLAQEIRDLADQKIDPITSDALIARGIYNAARSAPMTAAALLPGAWLAMGAQFANDNYSQLRRENPDMPREIANGIAVVAAPIQAFTEVVSDRFLVGRLPSFAKIAKAPVATWGSMAARTAGFVGVGTVTETGEEVAQDLTPYAIQAVASALSADVPSVPWSDVFANMDANKWELVASVIPLVLVGAGGGQLVELGQGRYLAARPELLEASGYNAGAAKAIAEAAQAEDWGKAETLMRGEYEAGRVVLDGAQLEAPRAAAAALVRREADERLRANESEARDAAEYGVRLDRSADGWTVTMGDGRTIPATSEEAAIRLRSDLRQAATHDEATALVSMIDTFTGAAPAGVDRSVTLSDEKITRQGGRMFADRGAGNVREITSGAILDSVRAQASAMGQDVDLVVNGSNEVFRERVGDAAGALVQRLTIQRSDQQAPAVTLLHEMLEANLKAANLGAVLGTGDTMNALGKVADVLPVAPARARVESLKARGAPADHIAEAQAHLDLRERLDRVVSGLGNETEMREIAVELAIADVIERDKSGRATGFQAGAISRALDEAARSAVSADEVAAIGRVRAFLRSVRAWLRGVFGTVAALKRAKSDGRLNEGDDLAVFVDRLLGLDGNTHARAVESEAAQLAGVEDDLTYSLSVKRHGELEAKHNAGTITEAETAEAQALVDEAAKRAGYAESAYIAAPPETTEFRTDKNYAFLADSRDAADSYTYGEGRDERVTYPVRLKLVKTREVDFEGKHWDQWPGPEKDTDGLAFAAKRDGYDSAMFRNVRDYGTGDRQKPPFTEYVVFSPSQIKSADPFTGTPLAERFNPADNRITHSLSPARRIEGQAVEPGPFPAATQSFSLSLVSVHNLTEENLAFAEKMGGLAVPSIGVVPSGNVINGFGEVTLIGGRHLGDPAENPVFSHDAYTVRFPAPDYAKAKTAAADAITKELRPYSVAFDDTASSEVWDNAINKPDPDKSINLCKRSRSAKAWFLDKVKGIKIEPVTVPARVEHPWVEHPAMKAARDAGALGLSYDDHAGRLKFGAAITEAVRDHYSNLKPARLRETMIRTTLDRWVESSGESVFNTMALERSAARVGKMDLDREATESRLDAALKGSESAFYSWLEDRFYGLHDAPRLKLGRKFVPYTLENIAAAMTRGAIAGAEATVTFGEGKLAAVNAKRFRSVEQMRKAGETSLKTEDEVRAIREGISARLGKWRQAVRDSYKWQSGWDAMDASMEALAAFLKGERSAARLESALEAKDFRNVPDDLIAEGVELAEMTLAAPVPYFESKPQRVVRLGEFSGAVVPADAAPETLEILSRHGIEIVVMPAGTRDTNARMQAMGQLVDVSGVSFSLSPARRIDMIEDRIAAMIDSKPDGSRKYAQAAAARLRKLRGQVADLPEPRTKGELDRQQAKIVEARRAELEEMFLAEVERDTGGMAYMPELSKLTEHPLADFLRTSQSKRKRFYAWNLEPEAKWRARQLAERGEIGGDYDGARGLPSIWFQGSGRGAAPDLQAKEAFKNKKCNLKGDSADDLWDAINAMLQEVAVSKERLREAQDRMKAARAKAKQEAEFEGRAWRAEQDEMQARLGSPRAAAARDLATAEALIAPLPVEVRGKLRASLAACAEAVGDTAFVKRMNVLLRQIDTALIKHWAAENRKSLDKLITQGQGKRAPGEKPQGTAGSAVHEYFQHVAAVVDLTGEEIVGARANIDLMIASSAGGADELKWIERGQILDAWGGFGSLHVSAQADLLEAGWDFYKTGRNAWLSSEQTRLATQRAQATVIVETLGQGLYSKLGKDKGIKEWIGSMETELRDFEGTLSALLGRDHELTKRWAGEVSKGYARKEDAMRALRARWQSALDDAMPGLSHRKQRLRLYEMRTKRGAKIEIQEEKADPMVTVEDRNAAAERGDPRELVASSVTLTEDQAIFLTMTARQDQYVEPLRLAGFTPEVLDLVEDQITPEGRALRDFMAREYDDGHAPLSAVVEQLRGIKLPKITNYSPGRFYNWGNEKPLDVMGTGTVAGGFADGFLKDRRAHFSQVKLAGALGVFWTHNHEAIHWANLAPIVREMRGALRNPNVKRSLEGAWGLEGTQLLESWMLAIEGNGLKQNAGAAEKLVNFATGKFAVARLAYNAGTIAKQSMALLNTALSDVPAGQWVRGVGEIIKHPTRFVEIYNSPVIQRRLENGYSPEVRMLLDQFWTAKPGLAQGLMEQGMQILGWSDAFFTAVSAAVVYEAHARMAERSGIPSASAHLLGMEAMERAVAQTAQPQTADRRSIFEHRQGALGKLLILFLTEARQKGAIWAEAWRNVVGKKATARDYKNLAVSHLLLAPMMAAITAAIRDWRDGPDDPEDDPAWELSDFAMAILLGPMQSIPMIGQGIGAIADKLAGRGHFGKSSNVLADPLSALALGTGDLLSDVFDDEDQTVAETSAKILRIMSEVGGVPGVAANILKQSGEALDQAGAK